MKTHITIRSFAFRNINKALLILLFIITGSIKLFADHDVDITGTITQLGSNFLVVQGSTFYIDENTELRGTDGGDHVMFSFFQLNDVVEVRGNSNGDGTFLATRVRLEDGPHNESEIEIKGFVTQVGISSFVINSNTIFVDSATEFRGEDGNPFPFAQITVGLLLEVKAVVQTSGDLLATRIKSDDNVHQQGTELEITGNIDSIAVSSIFIGHLQVFTDMHTIIMNNKKMPVSFSDLIVGEKVEVKAIKQPDATYLATLIKVEGMHGNEVEITAQIGNITGNNIKIGDITFVTDSNTVFLDNNRMPITLADLSVGMWVEVKGLKNTNGSYYASIIKVEDFVRTKIEVKGNITEITSSFLMVNGITFSVDSTTKVFDNRNYPIMFSSLQVGQLVKVKGKKTGLLTAMALRIKLEDNEDLEIFGKITAINTSNIMLNGLTVFVNAKTVFLDQSDMPITFSDLGTDQFVEVEMVRNPDSTLLALSIKIEDGMNFSKINAFAGVVTGSSIQLPSGNYLINSKTVVVDNGFNVISTNKLTVGQQVIVWAVVNASNKTALQIQSKVNSTTGVNTNTVPDKFVLQQNYPNPFNPSTTIKYQIYQAGLVSIKVYNILGKEIATLVNENKAAGIFNITFDASKLASGVYIYQLKANNFISSKKMVLLK